MRYTNRRFPFTFTFIVTCFLLLTRFGVSNRYVMCLLCCVCERASLWTFRLDEVWYGKMVKGSRLALSTASHQVFTQRLRVRKRYSLVMIKGQWCNVKKLGYMVRCSKFFYTYFRAPVYQTENRSWLIYSRTVICTSTVNTMYKKAVA